mmetsp:Transcript_9469/g.16280  ORF Transcript_9469/g.16280 Transcript_9469/m.16280 type:complete len:82 (-) Transcript_9469:2355-2600(-)
MGYCQALLHPAKTATPTKDVGLPYVIEQEYAEDNNDIVCTLKVVDSEGTLLAVVCPSCSHRYAPHSLLNGVTCVRSRLRRR